VAFEWIGVGASSIIPSLLKMICPQIQGFFLKSKASSSSLVGGCMWLDGVHHLLLLEKIYPQIHRVYLG